MSTAGPDQEAVIFLLLPTGAVIDSSLEGFFCLASEESGTGPIANHLRAAELRRLQKLHGWLQAHGQHRTNLQHCGPGPRTPTFSAKSFWSRYNSRYSLGKLGLGDQAVFS